MTAISKANSQSVGLPPILKWLLIGIIVVLISTAASHAINHGLNALPQRFFCTPDNPDVEAWFNPSLNRCVWLVEYDDGRVGVRVIDEVETSWFKEKQYEVSSYWKKNWNNIRENLELTGFEKLPPGAHQ